MSNVKHKFINGGYGETIQHPNYWAPYVYYRKVREKTPEAWHVCNHCFRPRYQAPEERTVCNNNQNSTPPSSVGAACPFPQSSLKTNPKAQGAPTELDI